ncbi:MAG: TonB-dependent receptor [Sphingobacteriaceae bacterium]|nr:TonB-dependent receptor [Sphingobacteriaceae bacterium]
MKRILFIVFLSGLWFVPQAQSLNDTSALEAVVVKAYFSDQPLFRAPASVSVIGSQVLQNQPDFSLLPAINTVPGVRMEERSPGSYRLSIRGSLLRSPFGIRNVKIYFDDFLLTDAGGNTYLNILDAAAVGRIEILKGPEGSIFGANSGGVVLISSKRLNQDSTTLSAGISAGSYGLLHQKASAGLSEKNFSLSLHQSFQRTDGYRNNSAMKRKSFQAMPQWNYSKAASLKILAMYSDLHYQTPGGLTDVLSQGNPRLARAVAEQQKAGIFNKTLFTGISHSQLIGPNFRHLLAITGSATDFENPFITNYETHKEASLGLRTYLELTANDNTWNWQYGLETQKSRSKNRNYKNNKGVAGDTVNFVDLGARQTFLFTRFALTTSDHLNIEAALSLNFYNYSFASIYPIASDKETRKFKKQFMPRLAMSYLLIDGLVARASVSRGYSPPTLEEVRPSNLEINTDLEPENGWNYEGGFRLSALNQRIYLDAVLFRFKLKDAIVRRVNTEGAEYFVNAGGTSQKGLEAQLTGWLVPQKGNGLLRGLKITEAYTYSKFKFTDYIIKKVDLSGKWLTGVPQHSLVSSAEFYFPSKFKVYIQHNFVSALPLNDANTFYAGKYHLLQARLNYSRLLSKVLINFYAGADNILNARYSLGNDLNAFGGNYFNPAASRNYYGGVTLSF